MAWLGLCAWWHCDWWDIWKAVFSIIIKQIGPFCHDWIDLRLPGENILNKAYSIPLKPEVNTSVWYLVYVVDVRVCVYVTLKVFEDAVPQNALF